MKRMRKHRYRKRLSTGRRRASRYNRRRLLRTVNKRRYRQPIHTLRYTVTKVIDLSQTEQVYSNGYFIDREDSLTDFLPESNPITNPFHEWFSYYRIKAVHDVYSWSYNNEMGSIVYNTTAAADEELASIRSNFGIMSSTNKAYTGKTALNMSRDLFFTQDNVKRSNFPNNHYRKFIPAVKMDTQISGGSSIATAWRYAPWIESSNDGVKVDHRLGNVFIDFAQVIASPLSPPQAPPVRILRKSTAIVQFKGFRNPQLAQ